MDKLSHKLQDTDKRIRVNKDNEVLRIQSSIEKIVITILNRVKLIDRRLVLTLKKVGSYYDGLKIGLPDEFDFLAEMVDMEEGKDFIVRPTGFNGTNNVWKCSKGQPGRRKIQYIGNHLHDTDQEEDESCLWMKRIGRKKEPEFLIDCISVKNTFYYAVLKVFKTLSQEDLPRYLQLGVEPTFVHGPAITLEFIWNGRSIKNLTISVDLTICIKVKNWATCIDTFEWMTENSCVSNTLRTALDKDGYHLTPYISDRGHSCQWRVSTSHTEHLLMESFSYHSKVKVAIRCLKYERDQHIDKLPEASEMVDKKFSDVIQFVRFYQADDENQQLVTSYMIKTTAFMTLGLLTGQFLNRIPLSVFYTYLIIRLYTAITFGDLRMFFISNYKLRVPEFGEILPGFKSLVDTVNENDVPNINTFKQLNANCEQCDDETQLEFTSTNDMFKQMKYDVNIHYNHWWRSAHAYGMKPKLRMI